MSLRKFAQASIQAAQKASIMAAKADSIGKGNKDSGKIKRRREADVPRFIGITSPKGM